MSPPYRFETAYDDGLVEAAAWTFAKRRVAGSRGIWIATALVTVLEVVCAVWLASPWPLLVLPGAALLVAGILIAVWRTHRAAALRKLRALGAGRATFTIDEAGLSVESPAGSTRVSWAAFEEVWEYPAFWILTLAENAYFTLPTASAPIEALKFARAALGSRLR